MSDRDNTTAMPISAIARNLEGIQEQRNRLRKAGDAICNGKLTVPQATSPAPTIGGGASSASQATEHGGDRVSNRVMAVFDQFTDSIVTDLSNVGQRTAALHAYAAGLGSSSSSALSSRIKADAVDVEVVEVEPDRKAQTS